jgi:hypothetical protein
MSLDHVSEPGSARRASGRLAVGAARLDRYSRDGTGRGPGQSGRGKHGAARPQLALDLTTQTGTDRVPDHQAWQARGALQELAAPKASIRDGAADSVARLYQ